MGTPLRTSILTLAAVATVLAAPGVVGAQGAAQIEIGAAAAARLQAARTLVPLLKGVKQRAQPGPTVQRGSVPNSPFTGTQTTLFAFSIGKRAVPVDPRVVAALDRLLAWNIGGTPVDDTPALFDRWLEELSATSSAALRLQGGSGTCDASCVARRMTTLDETWGASPRERSDVRDEALLQALVSVVTK